MQKWEYITIRLFIDTPDIDFEVGKDAVAQKWHQRRHIAQTTKTMSDPLQSD